MTKRAKPPTNLPAPLLDDQVVETIGHWFDKFVAQIRAEDSHSFLRRLLSKLVREGRMPLRRVIELTGDRNAAIDADAALRDMAEEILQHHAEMPVLLQSYLISHHPKTARDRGRRATDTWLRDQCIAVCVACARERWSAVIPMTRNDDTAAPGICDLVSRACHARGIPIGEKRVKQIYDRFAEFLPIHQGWLAIKLNSPI